MKTRALLTLAAVLLSSSLSMGADPEAKKTSGVPADYPLKKCAVSGEPLGEMGKPVKVTHGGTDVYLCCKSCLEDFEKDPAKYTQMVKDAKK